MRYITSEWFRGMVKYKFGYDIDKIYLNTDGSICGVTIGNCFWDSNDLEIRTGLILDRFRILNRWNLNLWKDLYGKKEYSK